MTTISWASGVSGDWGTAADWTGGKVPGATADVVVAAVGAYTVTINSAEASKSLTINDAGATVQDNNTLTLGTALTVKSGTFQLNNSVVGGTLSAPGGVFVWNAGTLTGVTYEGVLDMSVDGSDLNIDGGLTLAGAGGPGPGAINLTGGDSIIYAEGGETFDNASLDIGSAQGDTLYNFDPSDTNPVLTLGGKFNVVQVGANAQLSSVYGYADNAIVNSGSITANVTSGNFTITPVNFTNDGSISVSNGDNLGINPSNFTNAAGAEISVTGSGTTANIVSGTTWSNAGTIAFGAGTTGYIDQSSTGSWNNTGTLTLGSGATLSLGGVFTTAQLTGVTNSGGTIGIAGTLTNTGATLTVGPGTALEAVSLNSGASIVGGTIVDEGSGLQFNGGLSPGGATLEGVVYDGTVDLSGAGAALTLTGGFAATGVNGSGSGTINLTGQTSQLFVDGLTLDNATLNMGANSGYAYLVLNNPGDTNPILTLGSHFNIVQTGLTAQIFDFSGYADDNIVNDGAITAAVAGGQLIIGAMIGFTTNFTNNGSIVISNGDSLDTQNSEFSFANSISGSVSISGSGTVAYLGYQGTLANEGSITVATGGTLNLEPVKFTNLPGTTLTGGSFEADAGSTINLNTGAKIVTDNSTIVLSGVGSTIQALNSKSIDSTLATIAAAGTLELLAGRAWTTTLAMTNAGNLQLGGGTFTAPSLSNTGTVSGYGDIVATVTSSGTFMAQGGALSLVGGSLTNLSGSTLSSGSLAAKGAGATLQLANNTSIATLSGSIALTGGGSEVQGLNTGNSNEVTIETSLATITATGALEVLGGRVWNSTGALSNAGTIQLGGGTFTSGALANLAGGILTGFGDISSVTADAGVTTSVGGALAFTGTGDTFSGALGGTEIDFSGGSDALNAGAGVTAKTLAIADATAVTLNANVTDSGILTQASGTTLALGANTLTLSGTGSTIGGLVSGTGTLAFTGGSQAVSTGTSLTVSNWSLTGGTTTLNEALTYKGAFSEGAGATLTLTTGHTMTLTAATSLSGTVNGAGTLKVSNATVSGLDIGGTSNFDDVGTVAQTGTVTVGDATTKVATLTIGAGATYTIENNAGIGLGHAKTSSVKNGGTLTNTGTGTTTVAIRVIDTGTMVAATGTLDFVGPITGAGSMSVNAGATLESDMSVASTISMTFNAGAGVLALKEPSKFAATINGFAPSDTIDLLGKKATSAVLNGSDQLVITNGATAVATLQLTAANAGETFSVASDGNGGSDITVSGGAVMVHPTAPAVSSPAPHLFIAATAAMGGGAPGPVHSMGDALHTALPTLAAPRLRME